jgi:hypothetical protein
VNGGRLPDGIVGDAAIDLGGGNFVVVFQEAGRELGAIINLVFAGFGFQHALGADRFGNAHHFLIVRSLFRGSRFVIDEQIQGFTRAFFAAFPLLIRGDAKVVHQAQSPLAFYIRRAFLNRYLHGFPPSFPRMAPKV